MAAAVRTIGDKEIIAVSVIMGAPNLTVALKDSIPLINSVLDGFSETVLVEAGQKVGQYVTPWGATTSLKAKQKVSGVVWSASSVNAQVEIDSTATAPLVSGQPIGVLQAEFGRALVKTDIVAEEQIARPGIVWRLRPRID
jgi:D-alanyl-D-alanine carboxypeptidase